jgi:hypothetical protein
MQAQLMLRYSSDMNEKSKSKGPLICAMGFIAFFSLASSAEVEKENLRISPEKTVNKVYEGGSLDAEARLESIKQALVDITLGSEIELSSATYLDDSGVLKGKHSVMTTNAKVESQRQKI